MSKFQIFRLNVSRDMSKMHGSPPPAPLIFNFDDLKLRNLAKL